MGSTAILATGLFGSGGGSVTHPEMKKRRNNTMGGKTDTETLLQKNLANIIFPPL
jgi:hypothetical protein